MSNSAMPSTCSSCLGSGTTANRPYPVEAFLIILLPPLQDGSRPDCEAYYPFSDPLYACLNIDLCDCPPAPYATRRGSIECVGVGARFDGRIAGLPPGLAARQSDEQIWDRNTLRAHCVPRPLSCYAIITPDGLWHECFEPEAQDIESVAPGASSQLRTLSAPVPDAPFSKQQVAWRYEVERLLALYPWHWAVGCTVYLQFGVPQKRCTG